ncbi:MAG: N-acetylmuramoyl-L-alanine amidase [Alphaproteobacteria bacterium]|nr:N-acetylmuramoyl-L-alanine amidase [Alphaproteobacteria bacterium]PHX99685.1 MAG: N-acetylmuramoyl-L-alanine amidase [Rhodospirillaceae bacterium]
MTPPGLPRLKVIDRPSPNHGARQPVDGATAVRFVVLHYTGMATAEQALARLTDPLAQVSAHYLINDEGEIFHLVPEDRRAWHAGVSYWQGRRDLNSLSIGIEITNPGHDCGYRAFPQTQIDAVRDLVKDILARHMLNADAVIGHSDIAPGRKIDPGELFPWEHLASTGLGRWPKLSGTKHLITTNDAMILLSQIGYAVPLLAELGADILAAPADTVAAFQRHYRPARIDGVLDTETLALIQALAAPDLA